LQVAPSGAATSLALVPGDDGSAPGSTTLVFETTDIEADVAQLRKRGMDSPMRSRTCPGRGRSGSPTPTATTSSCRPRSRPRA